MTLEKAIKENPFDHNTGDIKAYARYIRYTADGMYSKTTPEVVEELRKYFNQKNENQPLVMENNRHM